MSECLHCEIHELLESHLQDQEPNLAEVAAKVTEVLADIIVTAPPSSPFHSTKELIDFVKANPGKLTYGTLGTSSSGNMAMGVFCQENDR